MSNYLVTFWPGKSRHEHAREAENTAQIEEMARDGPSPALASHRCWLALHRVDGTTYDCRHLHEA